MADSKKRKKSGAKRSTSGNPAKNAAPAAGSAKPKSSLMAQAEAKAGKITADREKSKKSGGAPAKKGGIVKYFKDLKSEIKKVTWPSKSKVINNTGVVLAGMCSLGILVWGVDSALAALLRLVTS